MLDEVVGAGKFGRDSDEADVTAACVDETIECRDAGREQMLGWLHAALFVGEERTFEVDAERTCTAGLGQLGDFVGESVERAQSCIDRCGDGGGEIGGGSARRKEAADGIERGRCCFHYVVSGSAVDVDIEK